MGHNDIVHGDHALVACAEFYHGPINNNHLINVLQDPETERKTSFVWNPDQYSRLILGLRPANERRCYFVATSLIGWAQT